MNSPFLMQFLYEYFRNSLEVQNQRQHKALLLIQRMKIFRIQMVKTKDLGGKTKQLKRHNL